MRIFDYHAELDEASLLKQVQKLYEEKISDIIIIDHNPSFVPLYLAINKFWMHDFPRITIHTFGGFTYRSEEYLKIEEVLKKFPLKIVAPSSRAKQFIQNHFEAPENLFHKVAFPVTDSEFNFDSSLFLSAKKYFGLDEHSKVITYAGRIAEGKNLNLIIASTVKILSNDPRVYLLIAGDFDDSMTPGFGDRVEGRAEVEFKKQLSEIDPVLKDRVRYLGKLSKIELKILFDASDIFLSLSTYPLEDFGMGPLEALACGCPAILTDWGGYTDFKSSGDCSLVDVTLDETGHHIDGQKVTSLLNDFLQAKDSADIRMARSHKYTKLLSPAAIAKELKLVHAKPFAKMKGFSAFARAYVWINKGEKFTKVKDTFYHSLYRSYFE